MCGHSIINCVRVQGVCVGQSIVLFISKVGVQSVVVSDFSVCRWAVSRVSVRAVNRCVRAYGWWVMDGWYNNGPSVKKFTFQPYKTPLLLIIV